MLRYFNAIKRNYSKNLSDFNKALVEYKKPTHYCGRLNSSHVGELVTVCGFLEPVRILGQALTFFSVRDKYGSCQVKLKCDTHPHVFEKVRSISLESCMSVTGKVMRRPAASLNLQSPTGEIEIDLEDIAVLNEAENVPFLPNTSKVDKTSELLRAEYRYLDIRSSALQEALQQRSKISQIIRNVLLQHDFVEIETPILFKSTPEGAREFIVPTRRNKGEFYALPQSPQQYKQLLMAGGCDRYFQIAKCFRDEDLRAERQPEFTQIDLEMSYARENDVQTIIENLIKTVWKEMLGINGLSFKRMKYQQAMNDYGSDKPDIRFDLKLNSSPVGNSKVVQWLNVKNGAALGNKYWKEVSEKYSAKFYKNVEKLDHKIRNNISETFKKGDIFLVGPEIPSIYNGGSTIMGRVRLEVADKLISEGMLAMNTEPRFLWIDSFPLFTYNEDINRIESTHHPFTSPHPDDLDLLKSNPLAIRGLHYDLVLNGIELGGGSVRIHNADLQEYTLKNILKLDENQTSGFSHLIQALRHGCPPHAGIALGLDRLVAILCNAKSIRDVIAFPKSQSGRDLLVKSPSSIPKSTLEEYHIKLIE